MERAKLAEEAAKKKAEEDKARAEAKAAKEAEKQAKFEAKMAAKKAAKAKEEEEKRQARASKEAIRQQAEASEEKEKGGEEAAASAEEAVVASSTPASAPEAAAAAPSASTPAATPTGAPAPSPSSATPSKKDKKLKLCRFWLGGQGNCDKGDACPFRHGQYDPRHPIAAASILDKATGELSFVPDSSPTAAKNALAAEEKKASSPSLAPSVDTFFKSVEGLKKEGKYVKGGNGNSSMSLERTESMGNSSSGMDSTRSEEVVDVTDGGVGAPGAPPVSSPTYCRPWAAFVCLSSQVTRSRTHSCANPHSGIIGALVLCRADCHCGGGASPSMTAASPAMAPSMSTPTATPESGGNRLPGAIIPGLTIPEQMVQQQQQQALPSSAAAPSAAAARLAAAGRLAGYTGPGFGQHLLLA